MEIKDWVHAARKHARWTQEQLGEALSVTKANVSHWERGQHKPSFGQMSRIAEITGYPMPTNDPTGNKAPTNIVKHRYRFSPDILERVSQLSLPELRGLESVMDAHIRALRPTAPRGKRPAAGT